MAQNFFGNHILGGKETLRLAVLVSELQYYFRIGQHRIAVGHAQADAHTGELPAVAGQGPIALDRLEDEVLVVREQGSGTRAAMERHFAQHGLHVRTGCELASNEAVKQAVQAGIGLGVVSAQTLELELETRRLVVLPVAGFPILRRWYVVHRSERRLSPAATALRSMLLAGDPAGPSSRNPRG